ncbi:MAG: o-succinylbenzoate synthase [Lentimicrobium sp.]|jgi:o-succinylbenzoate synthase|nr:o-succinylbenzoate synthase [Lentimicrobium sp.]
MLKARYHKHTLHFRLPAGTSRGVLLHRDAFYMLIQDTNKPGITGIGECGIIPGLSLDDRPQFEAAIQESCEFINKGQYPDYKWLNVWPSIEFALETAEKDLKTGGKRLLYDTEFTQNSQPIPINGLIWMGEADTMLRQINEKVTAGFSVLKMKVGAIDFEKEVELIQHIQRHYPSNQITIRLDANGAFKPAEAFKKLEKLARYNIHSIEQPIKAGNRTQMAEICRKSPIPIALDEELIGISTKDEMEKLMDDIRPQYIILKPSLLGGIKKSEEWIQQAENFNAGWWITSALESNIGLNAISQWTATLQNPLPQGLGTGSLYTNNITSPLQVENGFLHFKPENPWNLKFTGV